MTCPVCHARLDVFAEECPFCLHDWETGQKECPAILDWVPGQPKCQLPFRHGQKKHRFLGMKGPQEVEVTVLWHYPENIAYKYRSVDYLEATKC